MESEVALVAWSGYLLDVAGVEPAGAVIVCREGCAAVEGELGATLLGTVLRMVFSKTMIGSGLAVTES